MQNTDFYDSNESDYSDDDSDYDLLYEPEEQSVTRFNIVLCELYNERIHGEPANDSNVGYHYLTINKYKKLHIEYINDIAEYINLEYFYLNDKNHKIYRNYRNIIMRDNYVKPEIAECLYLQSGECIAIIKTFWIKIIQRKWKKIYKERQNLFMKRCSVQALKHRELTGKWPDNLIYPSIRGMLAF